MRKFHCLNLHKENNQFNFNDSLRKVYASLKDEDLVTNSSIFVDKSLFIKEIIEDSTKTILITMPRRWGKSLNLDMLKRFLSIEEQNLQQKEFNKKIFEQSIKTNFDKTKSQLDISTAKIKITDENIIGQIKVICLSPNHS